MLLTKLASLLISCFTIISVAGGYNDQAEHASAAALPAALVLGDNIVYTEDGQPTIRFVEGKQEEVISGDEEYPSQPVIAPDGSKLAYISPYEFEMVGEVWLYEPGKGKSLLISQDLFQYDESAKRVLWLDASHLLLLTGNTYGTITSNTRLDIYDLADDKRYPFVQAEANQDIRDISLKDNKVILDIATYDEEFMNATIQEVAYEVPSAKE